MAQTITNGTTLSSGVILSSGDVLTNTASGTITAPADAVYAGPDGAVSVTNAGSIGGGAVGAGIRLAGGGDVTNAAGGHITGYGGVYLFGAGSVLNDGHIAGDASHGLGVLLAAGGTLTNQGDGRIDALIGVYVRGSAGTVTNAGVVAGDSAGGLGVLLAAGGTIDNQDGGTITGRGGIYINAAAGTVTNTGQVVADTAFGAGIRLSAGGSVTNLSGAGIVGQRGISVDGAAGTVVNGGSISGSASDGVGVVLSAGGTVTNLSSGVISGYYGVTLRNGAGTLVNAGNIAGSHEAVHFAAGYADLLVVDPGAVFSGRVEGGNAIGAGAISTLELASAASAGTLSGLGTQFVHFARISVDASAAWTLTGSNTLVAGTTLNNAGTLTLSDALVNDGVVVDASTLTVAALSGAGSVTIASGGTLIAQGSVASGQTIAFASGSGLLQLTPGSFAGTIAGMQAGATIALAGITDATGASILPGNTLEITRSVGPAIDLQLDPTQDFTGDLFHLASVGGYAELTEAVPCYLEGTHIRTDRGEVSVERLGIGDRVMTLDGSAKPIKWIGRRSYAGAIPAGLRDVVPVLIEAGALGDNRPVRDLIVSPLHALYLDGLLVPAERLVNGRTIRRRPDIDPIRYVHIELDRHDVIFAEGAAAETFVDCDSRAMFHNAAEFSTLYPGVAAARWMFCAPRVEGGERLAAIRRALDERAGLASADAAQEPGRLLGCLDGIEGGRASGWAFQPDRPEEPVWLEVLDGDGVIARVEARRYRADLEAAGIGDGRHGFELHLTGALRQHRLIRVRRVADGAELDGSPLLIQPPPAEALAKEAGRLVAAAILDPGDGTTLDGLAAELLRGADTLRRVRAMGSAAPRTTRHGGHRRVLIIDSMLPDPARDAGSQSVLSHATALTALGWQVEFIASHQLANADQAAARLEAAGYVVHRSPGVASVEEVLRRHRNSFGLVYLHRLENAETYAPLARFWQSRAWLVYSVADLHHLRIARQAQLQASEELQALAAALRVREFCTMRLVNSVITHSNWEAAYLAQHAPAARVQVVPWTPTVRPHPMPFAARQGVAFIGSWTHEPNVDAVRWLAGTIMPLVWAQAPHIELLVAGSSWPTQLPWITDPRLRLLGPVESLEALLAVVRLTVAPLRFGAGLKGKVLDSLAAELPCVMTWLAAEGFELDGGGQGFAANASNSTSALRDETADLAALVADDAKALADRIVRSHETAGLNRAAASAGRRLVEAAYTPDAVQSALAQAITRPGTAVSHPHRERVSPDAMHAAEPGATGPM